MARSKLRDLLQSKRELLELTAPTQARHCKQLFVCGTAGPDEVGMVSVREAIGAGARCGNDRTLLEEEHCLRRTGEHEDIGNRFQSLRVCHSVASAVEHAQLDTFLTRYACEELGPFGSGGAYFQVRRARAAERAATEQRTTDVRATAARARDDSARRMVDWREPRTQDSCFIQDLKCALVSRDMELVSRRTLERAQPVRSNLRPDFECPEKTEGAASNRGIGNVEVHRDLSAALEVDASGGVKEPG
jgi:hypothetical protein